MRWTDSDNLRSRDALIVGGQLDGIRVAVREQDGRYRYPDVLDLGAYVFDPAGWRFIPRTRQRPVPARAPRKAGGIFAAIQREADSLSA